ncbi:MAG: hypothetical protein ACXAC7_05220 [Candidatus Hodarchaeales archaeon]
MALIFSLLGFLLAGFLCYLIIPFIIKSALNTGMTTIDAHKPNKPVIAEPGGLALLLSFVFAFSVVITIVVAIESLLDPSLSIDPEIYDMVSSIDPNFGFNQIDSPLADLLGGLLAIVLAGLIGFVDDVFGINLKWRHKILLGFLPALPLIILKVGNPLVDVPFIGATPMPFIYPFLVIPLATNFAFNSYNMFAGYNGLETGMGIVSFATIFIVVTFFTVEIDPAIMLLSGTMLGALVVFFLFNKYPAKILIGDVGTLMIGTGLIVTIILGNIERLALGIFFLYFINFILFFKYRETGQTQKLADIKEENGRIILQPPCPYTVYWILPYYRKITEKENVIFLIALQSLICFLTIIWFVISTS